MNNYHLKMGKIKFSHIKKQNYPIKLKFIGLETLPKTKRKSFQSKSVKEFEI